MTSLSVAIRRLPHGTGLPLPAYATDHAAGMDVAAAVEADVVLPPGGRGLIPTGIIIALPEGYEAQVRPRSGLAHEHGVTVLNAPGTIDADYRGEIRVLIANLGDVPFTVSRGMRIAQLVIAPVSRIDWRETEALPETLRSAGGFGSTGIGS